MIITSAKRHTSDYHDLESADHEDVFEYMNSEGYAPGQWIGEGAARSGLSGQVHREDFIHRTFGFHQREMTKIEKAEGVHPDIEEWARIRLEKWKWQHHDARIALRRSRLESTSATKKDRERLEGEIAHIEAEKQSILKKYNYDFEAIKKAEAEAGAKALRILEPDESKRILPKGGDPVGYTTALLQSKISDLQGELSKATEANDKKKTKSLTADIERLQAKGEFFFEHANDIREFRKEASTLRARAKRLEDATYHDDKKNNTAEANRLREEASKTLAGAESIDRLLKDMPGAFSQGITITASMHKSLSLAQHTIPPDRAKKLRECQESAVKKLMQSVGEKYAQARVGDEIHKVQGITAAMFHHNDARLNRDEPDGTPGDPSEHYHLEITKDVITRDGRKASLDPTLIFSNMKTIGAEGQALLAKELLEAGFDIEFYESEKGMKTVGIAGFSDADIEKHSKRGVEIKRAKAEGNDDQTAWSNTRGKKYDKPGLLDQRWREQYEAEGLKPDIANSTPRRGPEEALAPEGSFIDLKAKHDEEIIKRLTEREAHFDMSDIRQECWRAATEMLVYVSGKKSYDEGNPLAKEAYEGAYKEALEELANVEKRVQRIANHEDLREISQDRLDALFIRTKDGEPRFMSRKMLEEERQNMRFFMELAQNPGPALPEEERKRIIEKIEREKTAELRKKDPNAVFKFREDQVEAILHISDGRRFTLMSAKAGSGKTTGLSASIDILEKQGKKIILASSWNKATSQMCADTGRIRGKDVFTIAQLKLKVEDGTVAVGPDSVIMIDEAGLASHNEITWLRETAEKTGCSVLLQGDENQTAAVSAGKPFRRLVESQNFEVKTLDVIVRQKDENQRRATLLASRGDFAEVIDIYRQAGLVQDKFATNEAMVEKISEDFVKSKQPLDQRIALTTKNRDVDALNESIRRKLKESGQIGQSAIFKSKDSKRQIELAEGERICLGNRWEKEEKKIDAILRAGKQVIRRKTGIKLDTRKKKERVGEKSEFATIERIDPGKGLWIKVDGQKKATYIKASEVSEVKYGYAATISKSQGSTFNESFYMVSDFINASLAYVGLSRHKLACHIYATREIAKTLVSDMSRREMKIDCIDLIEDQKVVEEAFKKPFGEVKAEIEESKEIARDALDGVKADRNLEETRKTLDATDESMKRAEESIARIRGTMKSRERENSFIKGLSDSDLRAIANRPDIRISDEQRRRNETEGDRMVPITTLETMDGRRLSDIIKETSRKAKEREAERIANEAIAKARREAEQAEQARRQAEEAEKARKQADTSRATETPPIQPKQPKTQEQIYKEALAEVATERLGNLDRSDSTFAEQVYEELDRGADPHASASTVQNTILAYSVCGEDKDKYLDILAKCDEELKTEALAFLRETDLLTSDMLRSALEKSVSIEQALEAGIKPSEILDEAPFTIDEKQIDKLIELGADPSVFDERLRQACEGMAESRGDDRSEAPAPAPTRARVM